MSIFKKPLIGWGLFATVIALICLVMYNAPMSSSKGKGNKAFEGRGTFPDAVTAGVTLEWDESPEPDVVGYKLYHGPSPRTYDTFIQASGTMVTVGNLTPGTTRFFAVTAHNDSGTESQFSDELVYVVPAGATPPPTVTPGPTAPSTATPTPTIPPTPSPSPRPTASVTPSPTPGINVPATVKFTWITNNPFPTPFPITVTTSNGANWTSQDTCVWFDTCPQGGPCTNFGASGGQCLLQPHPHPRYPSCNLTFSAPGLPSRIVKVTMTMINPSPTPQPTSTPIQTPAPSPTAPPTPSPSPPPPTPSCTPCPCGN